MVGTRMPDAHLESGMDMPTYPLTCWTPREVLVAGPKGVHTLTSLGLSKRGWNGRFPVAVADQITVDAIGDRQLGIGAQFPLSHRVIVVADLLNRYYGTQKTWHQWTKVFGGPKACLDVLTMGVMGDYRKRCASHVKMLENKSNFTDWMDEIDRLGRQYHLVDEHLPIIVENEELTPDTMRLLIDGMLGRSIEEVCLVDEDSVIVGYLEVQEFHDDELVVTHPVHAKNTHRTSCDLSGLRLAPIVRRSGHWQPERVNRNKAPLDVLLAGA